MHPRLTKPGHALAAALALGLAALPLYACGDDDATSSRPTDGGSGDGGGTATPESGTPTPDGGTLAKDAAPDAASGPPIRCQQADFDKAAGPGGGDFTGFPGVDVSFPTTAAPAQYTNRCAKVKVGSDVAFMGNFSLHPLEPAGGTTPSPIAKTSTGDTLTVKVMAPGTYGYQCEIHPGSMNGAIQVVP